MKWLSCFYLEPWYIQRKAVFCGNNPPGKQGDPGRRDCILQAELAGLRVFKHYWIPEVENQQGLAYNKTLYRPAVEVSLEPIGGHSGAGAVDEQNRLQPTMLA